MAATTLAQYRTRIGAKLHLDRGTDASPGADVTLIDDWVNQAYEDVLIRTHCKLRPTTMALTSGTNSYTFATTILAIHEMYNTSANNDYLMERVTLQELSRMRQLSSTATNPARYYYTYGDLLEVYPTPGAGETLTIWYVARPTALAAAGDSPTDIPAEFHKLLEWSALSEGAEYVEHRPSQLGLHWLAKYEKGLSDLKAATGRRGSSRPARAKPGRSRDIVSSDPSVIYH